MSIKPIDLQTNIGQMHEVARGEQARTEGVVEQQHVLEKESDEKSRLVQSRLEENKKAERTIIKREEGGQERRQRERGREREHEEKSEEEHEPARRPAKGTHLGTIIDVKK